MLMSFLCGTVVAQTKVSASTNSPVLAAKVDKGQKGNDLLQSIHSYGVGKTGPVTPAQSVAKNLKITPMKRVGEASRRALPDTVRRFKWTATTSLPVRSALKRAAKASELKPDYYFSKDSSRYNGYVSAAMKLISQDGALKVTGVFGLADTVAISFNAASGTVSIAPQKIAYSSNYKSDVYIYAIDPVTNKYSTTAPITGTVDEGGAIKLGPWGVFVAEGESKGGIFDAYTHSVWMPSNATITNTNEKGVDTTFAACVEQTFDNELVIYNIVGNGTAVTATLTPQKQVEVSSQYIFTNNSYGDFFCFPINWNTKEIDTKSPIVGTGTSNTITLGGWVVSMRSNPTATMGLGFTKTVVTTTSTIHYPEKINAVFEGAGSASSPYLVKTVKDFYALSQAVAAGESYDGKCFRVENDIDFSGQSERCQPIGTLKTPFNGIFDGNHHILSNLALDGKGYLFYALFGVIGDNSILKNIVLQNASYVGSGQSCALLVGHAFGSVEGCTVEGIVKSTGVMVGGVIGVSRNSVSNTTFKGSVSGYGSIGGVAGNSYGKMTNCSAEAHIEINGHLNSSDTDGGGLVGEVFAISYGATALMTDCYFSGTVSDTYGQAYSGGLAGYATDVIINRCFNVGYIQSVNNNPDGKDETSAKGRDTNSA